MDRVFMSGNNAVGWGALHAGCEAFFGYPITPQNEIIEWFAREYPKRGKAFVQASSELSAINMVFGAASTGTRVMTSTSSPGWALMQETLSCGVNAEVPFLINLVQRGGPGEGTTRHAQMDYLLATRGGGQGGCRVIVLAPFSVQETHDFVQLAFHLADKYRNPVVILSEAIVNQIMEPVELEPIDFGPLPEKGWAARGMANNKNGQKSLVSPGQGFIMQPPYTTYLSFIEQLDRKMNLMTESETRYETYRIDDADIALVAYGYVARVCEEAIDMARDEGFKVGLIRPVTLWPFPSEILKEKASQGSKFLVIEDSLGQLVEDVRLAVEGKAEVGFLGMLARNAPGEIGMIFPDRVLEEIKKVN